MNVSQHKGAGIGNFMIWLDNYLMVETADDTDGSLKVIRCSMQNHMITPSTVFCHTF